MLFHRIRNTLKRSDYSLLLLILLLGVISFFAIYSSKYNTTTGLVQPHPYKQLKVFIIGIMAYFVIPVINYRTFARFAVPLYILGCALLVAVLIKGTGSGVTRWLSIGPFRGQPSEFFKVIWVIMLAWIFSDIEAESLDSIKLLRKSIWVIPPFILVYLQPDLGTTITYIAVLGIVAAFLGVRRNTVVILFLSALIAMPALWFKMKDFQRKRIIAMFNPEKYAASDGYQAIQSKIAIGSGGITGKGFLKGTQSHLQFMPESYTDFIFAVVNEEFGFVGGVAIISLFALILMRIVSIAASCRDGCGKVLCAAVAGFVFFQFYINVAMTMGIAPVVGIPLPFVSYGGSSLIAFMVMMGLVNSVHVSRYDQNGY